MFIEGIGKGYEWEWEAYIEGLSCGSTEPTLLWVWSFFCFHFSLSKYLFYFISADLKGKALVNSK